MRKITRYWSLVIIVLFSSCLQNQEIESKNLKFSELFFKLDVQKNQNARAYLIIQLDNGCSSCKNIAINFLKKHYKDANVRFIVSNLGEKIIKMALGNDIIQSKKIIIDKEAIAKSKGLVSDFPVLYYFKDNHIEEIKTLSASNIDEELHLLEIRLKK